MTIQQRGRLIDLELTQPITIKDKLASRVKELQKNEKLALSETQLQHDGLYQIHDICKIQKMVFFESSRIEKFGKWFFNFFVWYIVIHY